MGDFERLTLASKKSIRMCICCRGRFLQRTLLRLCIRDQRVEFFSGFGRSFYLCSECSKHSKAGDKIVKIKKLTEQDKHQIKEMIALWESQSKSLQ